MVCSCSQNPLRWPKPSTSRTSNIRVVEILNVVHELWEYSIHFFPMRECAALCKHPLFDFVSWLSSPVVLMPLLLFLWFCCMCGQCSRYFGLNSWMFTRLWLWLCLYCDRASVLLACLLLCLCFCGYVYHDLCLHFVLCWNVLERVLSVIIISVYGMHFIFGWVTCFCLHPQGQYRRFWTVSRRFTLWQTAARKIWIFSTVSSRINISTPC